MAHRPVVEADPGGGAVSVAESVLAPPGPIPNPVVTQGSAGEYCGGDPVGGEAAAGTAPPPSARQPVPRGGAAAARWAHNPKVAGSNPAPATIQIEGNLADVSHETSAIFAFHQWSLSGELVGLPRPGGKWVT